MTSDERVRVARELNESAQNMYKILIDELWDEPLENKMFAIDQAVGWKLGYPDDYALTVHIAVVALGTRDKINEHLPPKPTWIIHKDFGGFFCSLSVLAKLVKILIY